jgi:putative transposase
VATKSYKSTGRAVSSLQAHLVLTTKYRRKVLSKPMLDQLKQHIHNLCSKWNVLVIELEGENNHIHLLFSYYPQLDLCKFINNLKTVTSRLIRKEFKQELSKTYRGQPVLWNGSYFIASCGGVTVDVLRKYIEGQDTPTY